MDQITIAIPKGRNFKPSVEIFKSIGLDVSVIVEDTRKLLAALPEENVKFLVIRDTDIPTYVEYGAADIGVAGRDVLAEQGRDLYEPLDFKFGFCRMVLAEPKELRAGDDPSKWTHIRVATKFPKITENYFKGKGIQVEIIKLYGSIELAPLVGLSERIVDLVSTGRTLKENGLVEVEEIMKVTARLIVNRASLKTKYERVSYIIEELRSIKS
ncbi:MAG TPA: ATP phosphoribosyltransferase [Nitrospinota bacterium]|nr:ATP phosphoribosyltransferase [Nitrospinota bacterium]